MASLLIDLITSVFSTMVFLQAEILSLLRPAQWLGRFFKLNRAHVLFTLRMATQKTRPEKRMASIMESLKGVQYKNRHFHVTKAVVGLGGQTGVFQAWYLTPTLKWCDVIELMILPTESK
jgi:hypothetical protein